MFEKFQFLQKALLARIGMSPEARLARAEKEMEHLKQRATNYWSSRRNAKRNRRIHPELQSRRFCRVGAEVDPYGYTITYLRAQKEVGERLKERLTWQVKKVAKLRRALPLPDSKMG